jgi:hypothetical protein
MQKIHFEYNKSGEIILYNTAKVSSGTNIVKLVLNKEFVEALIKL